MKRLYTMGSLITILSSYVVPYIFLRNSRGLELFLFWTLLTLAWIIASIVYLRRVQQ
ncbi:hypothetical protein [Desulfurococcus mucosus]|uniref:hypothetical protein n=1 Tax=Desulfurococcus mucosus TaxID=2275 RepID=UPI000A65EF70|nr:hypothetical protein [Desulfurococcus mucosus]